MSKVNTLETLTTEYQLARNRWFAYKNSPEFTPGGIAQNIILSGMMRAKRQLDAEIASQAKKPASKKRQAVTA
jgi:hypothetical protein